LKELTGDWSEDEDEELPKQANKEKEDEVHEEKKDGIAETEEEEEEVDDIDLALKKLHKEVDDNTDDSQEEVKVNKDVEQATNMKSEGEQVEETESSTLKDEEEIERNVQEILYSSEDANDDQEDVTGSIQDTEESSQEAQESHESQDSQGSQATTEVVEEHLDEPAEQVEIEASAHMLLDDLIKEAATGLVEGNAEEETADGSMKKEITETEQDEVTEEIQTAGEGVAAADDEDVNLNEEVIVPPTTGTEEVVATSENCENEEVVEAKSSKPSDQVKSIINEWAEEDEDEGELSSTKE